MMVLCVSDFLVHGHQHDCDDADGHDGDGLGHGCDGDGSGQAVAKELSTFHKKRHSINNQSNALA